MRRSSWFTGVSVPYFASKIEAFATSRRSPGASVAVLLQHKCDRMCFEMMLTAHKGLGGFCCRCSGAVECEGLSPSERPYLASGDHRLWLS